jgi:hypothetical protein
LVEKFMYSLNFKYKQKNIDKKLLSEFINYPMKLKNRFFTYI